MTFGSAPVCPVPAASPADPEPSRSTPPSSQRCSPMSTTASERASAGDPQLTERLRAELRDARARAEALQVEYDGLLRDSGAIQEDRDNTRRILEAARAHEQAAE